MIKPKVTEQIRKMFNDSREFQRFLDDLSGITTFSNDLLKLFNARVAVASISNPVELKSISSEIESRLAITYSGTESALYGYTTSTLVENIPYVVLSDSGGSWVSMGGKYINDGLNIIDLVSSYIEIESTTHPQLVIKYDNTNYADIDVDSSGNITLSPSGLVAYIIGGLISTYANLDYIDLSTSATVTGQEARVWWNDDDKTMNIGLAGSSSVLQVGQEMHLPRAKATGSNILNGQVVYISGASGSKPEVTLAKADSFATSDSTIAVATENINKNSNGYFTAFGLVRDINTSSFNAGDKLYLSASTAGALTKVAPTEPNNIILIGYCIYSHATEGIIFVHIDKCTVPYTCVYGMTATYIPYASSNGFLKQKSTFTFNDTTDSLTVVGQVKGGTGYFGGSTHYSEFESDGTLKFNGNATVYKDLIADAGRLTRLGFSDPALVKATDNGAGSTGVYLPSFTDAAIKELQASFEIQHDYKEGTDLVAHLHWFPTTTDTGNVDFEYEYVIHKGATVLGNSTKSNIQIAAPGVSKKAVRSDLVTISGSGVKVGDQLIFRFSRDARVTNANDTFVGDVVVETIGIHYECDTVGSRQITTK